MVLNDRKLARPYDLIVGSSSSIGKIDQYKQSVQYGHCIDTDAKFGLQLPGYDVPIEHESQCWEFYCNGLHGTSVGKFSFLRNQYNQMHRTHGPTYTSTRRSYRNKSQLGSFK